MDGMNGWGTYQLADERNPEDGFWNASGEIGEDIAGTDLIRRRESCKDRDERSDDLRYDEHEDEMESIFC